MAVANHVLATLRESCVKGHHVYQAGAQGDLFYCVREALNPRSPAAILVKKTADGGTIGHIPNSLAVILAQLLDENFVTSITGKVTGPSRSAAIRTWSLGGGFELPCFYTLHGPKMFLSKVRQSLRDKKKTTNI